MMSMQQTPILDNFEKDKKSERRWIPRELAARLNDMGDYYLCTKYGARAGRRVIGSLVIWAVGFFVFKIRLIKVRSTTDLASGYQTRNMLNCYLFQATKVNRSLIRLKVSRTRLSSGNSPKTKFLNVLR